MGFTTSFFLKKWANPGLFFVYFRYFLDTISIIQIEKSIDGVLGIRTRGRRMVDTDETMELCRPPTLRLLCFNISAAVVNDVTIFLVEIFFPIFKTSKTSSSTKQEIFFISSFSKFLLYSQLKIVNGRASDREGRQMGKKSFFKACYSIMELLCYLLLSFSTAKCQFL